MKTLTLLALSVVLAFLNASSGRPDSHDLVAGQFQGPVRINSKQAQILKRNAEGITALSLNTKKEVALAMNAGNKAAAKDKFTYGIGQGIPLMKKIETEFQEAVDSKTQDEVAASNFFFGGIKKNIQVEIDAVGKGGFEKNSKDYRMGDIQTMQMPTTLEKKNVNVLDRTAILFEVVASTELLTFDLDVSSTPQNADVSYKRAGESYSHYSQNTNTTIHNLAYALWTIRAIQSNRVQEKEHDPFREKYHVVHFDF